MKIYLASGDDHTVTLTHSGNIVRPYILLSYYDLEMADMQFRNKTLKIIKDIKNENISGIHCSGK